MNGLLDYSQLAAPDVVEVLNYETILAEIKADLLIRDPSLADVLAVESDPLAKLLEQFAYRELGYRQRVNDAARARMLPFAAGGDLDYLGIDHGILRYEITPANPDVIPPLDAVTEADDAFRARIMLAISAKTTAGAVNSYRFLCRSADSDVKDEYVFSPSAGIVSVTVLSKSGDGTPGPTVLGAVTSALNADDVRPLTDQVNVQAATIVPLTVTAEITIYPNLDSSEIQGRAEASLISFLSDHHKLGHDITIAGLHGALMLSGVQNVAVSAPAADVVIDDVSAAYCAAPTVTVAADPVL